MAKTALVIAIIALVISVLNSLYSLWIVNTYTYNFNLLLDSINRLKNLINKKRGN